MRILAATRTGLVSFDSESGAQARDLEDRRVGAVAPAAWKRLWAVVDDRQIWSSEGDGWRQVAALDGLDATCLADTRANREDGILVGTSLAGLVRVHGDGELEEVQSFDAAPGRDDWFTPWGGPPATRTITEDRNTVYVNVHVGGVLRSRDEGASWEPTIDIDADVHQVATAPGYVYAAGARGLSVSPDRGESWRTHRAGLHADYCRAVAVCGEHLLVSASDGPRGGRAAAYRSDSEGSRFERCGAGLPEWFRGNIDSLCLDALPGGELAAFGTESGELYASTDEGETWKQVASSLAGITRVLVLP